MKQSEANRLSENLVAKFGLPMKASILSGHEGQHIVLEPEGVHRNDAFQLKINIGWRSLLVEFVLGIFAADFLHQMANCSNEKKLIFSNIAQEILVEKGVITFRINEIFSDPLKPANWPVDWKSVSLSLKKSPLEINTDDHELTERLTNLWVERFFGCVIALSPLEEVEENIDIQGLPEGAVSQMTVNRYERSRYNRAICLNFHGYGCKVCGMDFESIYGPIGKGFIHVHHVTPVSQMGVNYAINPIKDLIPLCPNCHSIIHRKVPMYSIEELKEMIRYSG